MKKGTIIRTIMLVIVLVNMALKACGKDVLNIDEGSVTATVEALISIAIIVLSWWKNNSITKNAQDADRYLSVLKEMDGEEVDDDE